MSALPPNVHIVDDDAPFLTATARLLRTSGFAVQVFASATHFLAQHQSEATGCVVADLRMPGMDGLALQEALAQTRNPLPILFLTANGDVPSSVRAMRGGAEDFLIKTAPKAELLDAIRRALARDVSDRARRIRRREVDALFETLTDREREVFGHVVRGRLNKQIAGDLGIAERTVKHHRASIATKLRAPSVAEWTRFAHELGLLS